MGLCEADEFGGGVFSRCCRTAADARFAATCLPAQMRGRRQVAAIRKPPSDNRYSGAHRKNGMSIPHRGPIFTDVVVIVWDAREPLSGSIGNRKQFVTYPGAAIEYGRQFLALFRPGQINNVCHVTAFSCRPQRA
jgi:hypothetical protein